ncbi:MAG: alpha-hydroxy acid oxidase [Thermoanaerobaculia bacterium]|nr:alpha-hydroxy acid oxidase [Thermoanaerobaculia bacterium]
MSPPLNLREYEAQARERLPAMVWAYYAGGADDELTLAKNERDWERLRLRYRVLVDVSEVTLTTTVLGQAVSLPILSAPCAANNLAHPEGELAVARAVAAAGSLQIVSTLGTRSLEEIAASGPAPRWFQLYVYRDRGVTRDLIARAERVGYQALCLTVDAPRLGRREREIRSGFHLPPGQRLANLAPYAAGAELAATAGASALARYVESLWDPSLDWSTIAWLREQTRLPIVVKGLVTAEDARLAVEHGVAGIVVSNHGGRQLDGSVTGCEALPEVVTAVAGRCEVLVDGGIRRGTDVLKALALGARAVLVGRPYLWALAVDGEAGVSRLFELLREELRLAMTLAGVTSAEQVPRELVVP